MKKIDMYVDEICHNFDESDEEIETIKEEMKSHLYEEIEELKKQGFSEEESIEKSIKAFGKENNVVKEMNTIWKKENEFTKIILKGALATCITACLFMIVGVFYRSNNSVYVNSTSEYTINEVLKQISDNDNFKKDEIDKVLNKFNNKNNDGLYYVRIEKLKSTEYEYKKDISKNMIENAYEGKIIKGNIGIYYKETDLQKEKDLKSLYKLIETKQNPVNVAFKEIAYILFLFSGFILCMAFYSYIGEVSKIVCGIAILDFGLSGFIIASVDFPGNVKLATICIWTACLLAFIIFKICFNRKKNPE
ncbi:hypothetical protein HBE96_03705 [Clostridium sp. P21]|uniref:Uncharacterized protein n=1 Tax=Clostridium muellerianum TaxID=2716538 RepID=A0A7Y0EEB3_9CLOT|nr:permease prefix domain 1-containing protein [Clostridium muellerianum]NMM61806.1 hypothetical protein [Clostridium muellerianum]